MRRFGSILGLTGPALLLAILAQPIVRTGADAAGASTASRMPIERLQVTSVERPSKVREIPSAESSTPTSPRASTKPRRLMKEGCEGAISSLAGPEARRMVPGRCIA